MLEPLALGLIGGLGLWCMLRGLVPLRRPLGPALEALHTPRHGIELDGVGGFDSFSERFASWVMLVTDSDLSMLRQDLAVMERTEEYHLIQRFRTGLVYGIVPLAMWLVFTSFGLAFVPLALAMLIALAMAVFGWFVTDSQVSSAAADRRQDFESALVSYVQLMSIQLAGGSGIDEALRTASDYGSGWSFQVLRSALTDARTRGVSPWVSLDAAGTRYGLDSLIDLASTMELAGVSGAHIRESLLTKARALRNHQINNIEREASSRTLAMAGPTSFMVAGFIVLIGYPAFNAILNI